MAKEILIEVKNVSKKFSIDLKRSLFYGISDIMAAIFLKSKKAKRLRKKEFWAVRDVSFTLRRGECLGLIGHNGAGKSTMLKMLNGLIKPDHGEIIIRGKIGALIELSAGFNPILTGRENIYNNGSILGFTKKEIDEKYDAIVAFSEIGEFINMPVQNYSSGMKVRLGFAVAAQMEPDVLLIDEVLAVGDMGFVLKCLNTIDDLLNKTAVIFVSHSMPMVARISSHILLMNKGIVTYNSDNVSEGIDKYYANYKTNINKITVTDKGELTDISFQNEDRFDENNIYQINRLDDLILNLEFKVKNNVIEPHVALQIFDKEQRPIGTAKNFKPIPEQNIIKSDSQYNYYKIELTIPRINLSKGLYSITFILSEHVTSNIILRFQQVKQFQIISEHEIWTPVEFETILQ